MTFNDHEFDRIVSNSVSPPIDIPLPDDTDLKLSGLGSLGFIKLVIQLERALGITWPIEQQIDYGQLMNVGALRRKCRDIFKAA